MNSGIPLRSRHGQHFIKMYFKMSSTQSKSKSFSRYVQCKAKKKKKGISVRQNSPARVPRQRASTHTLTHTHIHLAVLTVIKLILPEKCHRCSPALYPHGPEPESSAWLHNSHYQAFSGICCMYCTHFTFPV